MATFEGLTGYLEMVKRFQGERSVAGFILDHGCAYTPDAETYKGRRGRKHRCFENAGEIAAFDDDGLLYVEGYVGVHGVPLEHAWLTDASGRLIDPTLRARDGSQREYFGVAFSQQYVRRVIMHENQVWGIFSRPSPALIRLIEGKEPLDWRPASVAEVANS